jgi:hypothetical protein
MRYRGVAPLLQSRNFIFAALASDARGRPLKTLDCVSVSEETRAFTHVEPVYTDQEENVVRFLYPVTGGLYTSGDRSRDCVLVRRAAPSFRA